jgi:tetrahydromethanopterin S-methyltransferase subunit C
MTTPIEQVPPMPAPGPSAKTNVLSIISLIVGVLGLLGVCVAFFIPVAGPICDGLLAIAAVVTGFIGMSQVGKTGEKGKGMAIAGLIMGFLALLAACLMGVGTAFLGPVIGNVFSQINSSLSVP